VDDSLKVASLLSLIGGKTYNLLRTLTSPTKPAEKSYQEIIKLMGDHLSPKPLSIFFAVVSIATEISIAFFMLNQPLTVISFECFHDAFRIQVCL
jgi:hypothetical protein